MVSTAAVVASGREAVAGLMVDTGTITRPGPNVFDPETGLLTPSTTSVHSGACYVRMPTAVESERLFGDQQVTATRFTVCFPYDTTGVQVGDTITVTSADDDVTDAVFTVVAVPRRTDVIYKGFGCEVVE